jgi:chromosome partitioning protein
VIERFDDRYEWCLIDCPPSIGLLTFNALRAASEVLIPVETSFFSLRGAHRQARTIESLARRLGGRTPYRILPTMHDPNHRLANEILDELNTKFPDQVIPHAIRRDEKLKEAASFGQPLIEYEHSAPGAMDYADLAVWLIAHPPSRSRGRAAAQARKMPPAMEAGAGIRAMLVAQHGASNGAMTNPANSPQPEPGDSQQPQAEPATVEDNDSTADQPRPTRAAELAVRARRLLAETAAIKARIDADPDVAHFLREQSEEDHRPTPEQLQRLYGVHQTSRGALFVHPGGETSRLFIAGDFNGWSPTASPLRFNKRLGVHEACIPLPAGKQRYRLIVDGRWVTDPYNKDTAADRFGELTSVVSVRQRIGATACEGAD